MFKALDPKSIHPPFARYAHGVEIPAGARLVATSGQLGVAPDGSVPEDVEAQADLCFRAIEAIGFFPAGIQGRDRGVGGEGGLIAKAAP